MILAPPYYRTREMIHERICSCMFSTRSTRYHVTHSLKGAASSNQERIESSIIPRAIIGRRFDDRCPARQGR